MATMLFAPLGCVGADESAEPVGEAAEALNNPVLVATPSPVNFGSVAHGGRSILSVTLSNTGDGKALSITVAYPPDTYRPAHNPPTYLDAGTSSNVMQIQFAPTTVGTFTGTVVVTYYNITGVMHTVNIPVTGTGTGTGT